MCVSAVTTYTKKFGLNFAKELPTKREFSNFVDHYAVAMKKDSSDYAPSGFQNSFGNDPACFVVKYSSITLHGEPHKELKISQDGLSQEIKVTTDFKVANNMKRENKVLVLKSHYTVYNFLCHLVAESIACISSYTLP